MNLAGKCAAQWGRQRISTSIRTSGGYVYLKGSFGAKDRQRASFGCRGRSGGDSPTPGRTEDWNPVFSRRPKWSEK